MRYPKAYNPFTSGSEEDDNNPFDSSDEETGDHSVRGSMVNLLSPAREYNPFLSSGEEDHPHQLHNKVRGNAKKTITQQCDPFISSEEEDSRIHKSERKSTTKIINGSPRNPSEYNPFSSSDEEEDQLLQNSLETKSKSGKRRGKIVGLLVISLGLVSMVVILILVMTNNQQMFYNDIANTSVTITVASEIYDTDRENIHETNTSDTYETYI